MLVDDRIALSYSQPKAQYSIRHGNHPEIDPD